MSKRREQRPDGWRALVAREEERTRTEATRVEAQTAAETAETTAETAAEVPPRATE